MITILVAEDDKNIRKLLVTLLEKENYTVLQAKNGVEALELIETTPIDLLVLDIMMPEMDGYQTVARIRQQNEQLPVIIVTAKQSSADKKMGFLLGTDDYMVKPIDEEEFLLRVRALLRRTKIIEKNQLNIGQTLLDIDSFSISYQQNYWELPKKEFMILHQLLLHPNKIFTRQQLLDNIWGFDALTDERTIDVHIKRLRKKLESNQDFTIVTVRGLGYKVIENEKST